MLKIGEFSILSQISIHMLRHYDDIGLLIPEHVDDFTGYRYYSEHQLPIANKIQALKSMGLGLTVIKEILSKYTSNDQLKGYLELHAVEQREKIANLQKRFFGRSWQRRGLNRFIAEFPEWTDIFTEEELQKIYFHFIEYTGSILPELPYEISGWESGIFNPHRASRDKLAQAFLKYKDSFGTGAWEEAAFY